MEQKDDKWVDIEGRKAAVVLADSEPIKAGAGDDAIKVVEGRTISIGYAKGNAAQIIPLYVTTALPKWFGLVFLLTLLSAAMSTLSSQFHTPGTSIGRDVFETVTGRHNKSIVVTRTGIVVGIIIAAMWSYYSRESTMIARATAIFFGLCASSFLPALAGGLFFKRMTRAAAISPMVVGFLLTGFWLLFVKAQEAGAIGLVQKFTNGKESIFADYPNWPVVDPIVVALPVSAVVAIVVSLMTKPPSKEHIAKCFGK